MDFDGKMPNLETGLIDFEPETVVPVRILPSIEMNQCVDCEGLVNVQFCSWVHVAHASQILEIMCT